MFSNAEVAQVLEDAADLYESEKIEWCKNTWGGVGLRLDQGPDGKEPFEFDPSQVKKVITACAATSLALVAGLGLHLAGSLESIGLGGWQSMDDDILVPVMESALRDRFTPDWVKEQTWLYGTSPIAFTARGVKLYIQARLLVDQQLVLRFFSSSLPNFNDAQGGNKRVIVDLFKDIAKDLRNA